MVGVIALPVEGFSGEGGGLCYNGGRSVRDPLWIRKLYR